MTKHDRGLMASTALRGRYNPLERKEEGVVPAGAEFKKLGEDLMKTFEAFKAKNDESLKEIARKKIDDVVLKEHVDRINSSIDDVRVKLEAEILEAKRAAIFTKGDDKTEAKELTELKDAFDRYLRKGGERSEEALHSAYAKAIEAKALSDLEAKALSTNSEADGGFTVLPQIEQAMVELALLVSPIRSLASITTIGTGSLKIPVNKRGTAAGWVGETDPRAQTATSQLAEIEFVPGELYAMPAATQQMLDDSYINVEQWIALEAALKFAQVEGQAFVSGDGSKKPKGFLAYPIVADASWAWGSVGYFATGASGDFTAQSSTIGTGADIFFDLIAGLKYPYRPNAQFLAKRTAVARLRKIKNTYADYLWVPGLQNGQADAFAGYPLVEVEDMPDIAASSYSVAFGDFKQFYQIVDRVGVRTLRDPYTLKPYVLFYMTKRVGGGIKNFEAAKYLKFAVS